MWYNCLSIYLLKKEYVKNPICWCIFIKKLQTQFEIIVVYIDDLNLVGTPEELIEIAKYSKKEFKIKDCLDLQIEHFSTRVSVHQSSYIILRKP